jgi:hypothetical protein
MLIIIGLPDRFEVVNVFVTVVFWPVAVIPVTARVWGPSANNVVSTPMFHPTFGQPVTE